MCTINQGEKMDLRVTDTIKKAVRPLIFYKDYSEFDNLDDEIKEEYPYESIGTGFFLEIRGKFFFVTARHNLRPQHDIQKLRILHSSCHKDPTPKIAKLNPKGIMVSPEEDGSMYQEDYQDIIIIEYPIANAGEMFGQHCLKYDLNSEDITHHHGDQYFVGGYPFEMIEHCNRQFFKGAILYLTGSKIAWKGKHDPFMFQLEIESSSEIDFNGISGSPVLKVSQSNPDTIKVIGMVIRGSSEQNIIHFVSIEVAAQLAEIGEKNQPPDSESTY